jgi:predicted nucleic acid-binding protein
LSEFFSVVTRKLTAPLTIEQAAERMANFLRLLTVVPLTELIVLEAIRGVREHQLSLWDAQIWATAKLNQIPVILSEDLQHNRVLEGIRVVDSFQPEFRVDEWL